jgi:hypothetical protein
MTKTDDLRYSTISQQVAPPSFSKEVDPKFMSPFNQKKTIAAYVLSGFVALMIGMYFRLYPLRHYTPQNNTDKATLLVINKIKHNSRQTTEKAFSHLTEAQRSILAQELFNKMLRENRAKVNDSIHTLAEQMGQQQSQKNPFLLASDSYYYLNLTENILRTGQISDTFKGSKYLNPLMLAPYGHWEPLNFHAYIGYVVYSCLRFFNPHISLTYAVSFTPLLLSGLSLIPFIFLCYSLRCRPLPTFISSVFFILAPIFIKRSMFGWYDNDPYNVLFPALLLASFIDGLQHLNDKRRLILTGILSALIMTAYTFFWQGWVFVFAVFASACFIISLTHYVLMRNKQACLAQGLYFGIFLAGSFALIGLTMGFQEFFILFLEGWRACLIS